MARLSTLALLVAGAMSLTACASDGLSANGGAVRQPGLVSLAPLQYRVLKSGPADGVHPTRADEVVVNYEGRLVNGQVFDASSHHGKGPSTFPLGKLIPGWVTLLQLMRPGDEWELYIPPEYAYGEKGVGPVPPNATLIFKVELVSVKAQPKS